MRRQYEERTNSFVSSTTYIRIFPVNKTRAYQYIAEKASKQETSENPCGNNTTFANL